MHAPQCFLSASCHLSLRHRGLFLPASGYNNGKLCYVQAMIKLPGQALTRYGLILLLALCLPLTAVATEQSKVVLHLSNQHKLHVLVENINNLRAAYGEKVDIMVVVNGSAVTKFASFSNTEEQIQHILDLHASISVCSIAMRNRQILKEQLLDGVSYLQQGGVAKLIELQEQGYAYIKI